MNGITLKVSPDVLKSKAQEIESEINRIQSYWKQISKMILNSRNYWAGEASEEHQKYRVDVEDDMQVIFKRLREHPRDLLSMADIYISTEQEVIEEVSVLPDDVIV